MSWIDDVPKDEIRFVFGIKPGISGAIALLEIDIKGNYRLKWVVDMPWEKNDKGQVLTCIGYIHARFNEIRWPKDYHGRRCAMVSIWVEDAESILANSKNRKWTKRKAITTLNLGKNIGILEALAKTQHWGIKYVNPAEWKKILELTDKNKREISSIAADMFSETANQFDLEEHYNRAEAVLIALYGFHQKEADRFVLGGC